MSPGGLLSSVRGGVAWLTRPVRSALKWTYYAGSDLLDVVRSRQVQLRPPRRLTRFVGGGDYCKTGEEFLGYFVNQCKLQPVERVLDVGCGIGRMAIPLLQYLRHGGTYDGFDIVREGIDWCTRRITSLNPDFRFRLANIYNGIYNPTGTLKASEFVFPYENSSFDFVFLTSVFTHMLPRDLEHYLGEIARVLKPGGRCFVTYFLLNPESKQLLAANRSTLDFRYQGEGYVTTDMGNPEGAVGYAEERIRELHQTHGLPIAEPIYYGSWCGRTSYLSYQDIVIAGKF